MGGVAVVGLEADVDLGVVAEPHALGHREPTAAGVVTATGSNRIIDPNEPLDEFAGDRR